MCLARIVRVIEPAFAVEPVKFAGDSAGTQAGHAPSLRSQQGYQLASASTASLTEFPHTERSPSVLVDHIANASPDEMPATRDSFVTGRDRSHSRAGAQGVTFCMFPHPTADMEIFVGRVLSLLATIVDASTGAAIGVGVLAALVRTARLGVRRGTSLDSAMSEIRITLGRWLALALEPALAADILRNGDDPHLGRDRQAGSNCRLRTVLNYFLEREIEQEQKKTDYVLEPAA